MTPFVIRRASGFFIIPRPPRIGNERRPFVDVSPETGIEWESGYGEFTTGSEGTVTVTPLGGDPTQLQLIDPADETALRRLRVMSGSLGSLQRDNRRFVPDQEDKEWSLSEFSTDGVDGVWFDALLESNGEFVCEGTPRFRATAHTPEVCGFGPDNSEYGFEDVLDFGAGDDHFYEAANIELRNQGVCTVTIERLSDDPGESITVEKSVSFLRGPEG